MDALLDRRLPKVVLIVLLAVLSPPAAACGSSDEEQIEETIRTFHRAAAKGDGEGACRQLTPAARTPTGGVDCEGAIDQLGRLGGETTKRRLAAVEVRKVSVRGEQASAEAEVPTQTPTTLRLRKVERKVLRGLEPLSEWKLDSLGTGPGGGF